jgi:hypothetical protein
VISNGTRFAPSFVEIGQKVRKYQWSVSRSRTHARTQQGDLRSRFFRQNEGKWDKMGLTVLRYEDVHYVRLTRNRVQKRILLTRYGTLRLYKAQNLPTYITINVSSICPMELHTCGPETWFSPKRRKQCGHLRIGIRAKRLTQEGEGGA